MKTIRKCTFETNSSSCHSVSVMMKEDWEDFKDNRKFFFSENVYGYDDYEFDAKVFSKDDFITFNEVKSELKETDALDNIETEEQFREKMEDQEFRNKFFKACKDYEIEAYNTDKRYEWPSASIYTNSECPTVLIQRELDS